MEKLKESINGLSRKINNSEEIKIKLVSCGLCSFDCKNCQDIKTQ